MAERQIPESELLPNNSQKSKKTESENKIKPVVTSKVRKKDENLGTKAKKSFVGDDAKNVGEYVVMDVLIPAAKRAISDAVSQGIERLLFGESRPRSSSHPSSTRYTSYASYSRYSEPPIRRREDPRNISYRARAQHDFSEIIIEDRTEAELVIDQLGNIIDEYDVASVSDLYDLVGITGEFTDRKWGWNDIRGASVRRVRDGYLLILPKPQPIQA